MCIDGYRSSGVVVLGLCVYCRFFEPDEFGWYVLSPLCVLHFGCGVGFEVLGGERESLLCDDANVSFLVK